MGIWGPVLVSAGIVLLGQFATLAYFSGVHAQRMKTVESDVEELKQVDNRQWSSIGSLGERVSYVEARVNGKSH